MIAGTRNRRQIEYEKYKRKHVAQGFKEDAFKLLQTFVDGGKYDFTDFSKLWNDVDMSLIYMGRTSRRELSEFTNECFAVTVSLLAHVESPLHIKVGAVYLLYCLYGTQPFEKYKIRVTLEAWKEILKLCDFSRTQKISTLYYIILKLVDIPAVHHVGHLTLMGPEVPISRSLVFEENLLSVMVDQKWNEFVKKFWHSPLLQKYREYEAKFESMKKAMDISNTLNAESNVGIMKKLEMAAKGDPAIWDLVDDNRTLFGDEGLDEEEEEIEREVNLDIGFRRSALKAQQMEKSAQPKRSVFEKSLASAIFDDSVSDGSSIECVDDPAVTNSMKKQSKRKGRRSNLSNQEKEMLDLGIAIEQSLSDSSCSSRKSHRILKEEAHSVDDESRKITEAIFGESSNSNRTPKGKSLRPRVLSNKAKDKVSHSHGDVDDPQFLLADVSDSDVDYEPGKVKTDWDCEFTSSKAVTNGSKTLMLRRLSSSSRASNKSPRKTVSLKLKGKKGRRKRRKRIPDLPVLHKPIKRNVGKGKKLKCHYNIDSAVADGITIEDDPVDIKEDLIQRNDIQGGDRF